MHSWMNGDRLRWQKAPYRKFLYFWAVYCFNLFSNWLGGPLFSTRTFLGYPWRMIPTFFCTHSLTRDSVRVFSPSTTICIVEECQKGTVRPRDVCLVVNSLRDLSSFWHFLPTPHGCNYLLWSAVVVVQQVEMNPIANGHLRTAPRLWTSFLVEFFPSFCSLIFFIPWESFKQWSATSSLATAEVVLWWRHFFSRSRKIKDSHQRCYQSFVFLHLSILLYTFYQLVIGAEPLTVKWPSLPLGISI